MDAPGGSDCTDRRGRDSDPRSTPAVRPPTDVLGDRMPAFRIQHAVRTSLWLVPLLCLLAGALLVTLTLVIDRATGYTLVPQSVTGTPSDAQTILSTIASSMASLTTLVLTVTLVAVQLAMGQ